MSKPNRFSARDRLIVALDVPSAEAAVQLADKLREHVGMFKVGLELFTAEGPLLARRLVGQGEKVFLDLKLHDIPNTVRAAARAAAKLGASMIDVHGAGGLKMMQAALEGASDGTRGGTRPCLLAVTLLTSLNGEDLPEIGVTGSPETLVIRLAWLAQRAGLNGVVASPQEVAAIRKACGPGFLIVTPGIRPASAESHDQARVATPEKAIHAGADFLVVGRPITQAADPSAAADTIVKEMERALASGQAQPVEFRR